MLGIVITFNQIK